MSTLPVFLEPKEVLIHEGLHEPRGITSDDLAAVAARSEAVLAAAAARRSYLPQSEGVSDGVIRWADARRVLYATIGRDDGDDSIEAFVAMRDGRLVSLYGLVPRARSGSVRRLKVRVWSREDWDAFMEALKDCLTGGGAEDQTKAFRHAEMCGTLIELHS